MRMENLIVAALWHGPTKPNMNDMLQPILKVIQSLKEIGVPCVQGTILSKPKLLMAIFDLPAKASATNTKQFNVEYGCFYCFDKGEMYAGARIYPPDATHQVRTNEQMKKLALLAKETGKAQHGVKGESILAEYIEFPACIPIDYMHSILEGVFKQLMRHWFDSKFYNQPYSLRKFTRYINKMIKNIKPPNEIPRLPRALENTSFFKASEYRAWLLFYGLPNFSEFLPPEHTHHFSLLVVAMHVLLSEAINLEDLDIAHEMLVTFHDTVGDLYSPSMYTANMHSLVHTVPLVRLWGPLWAHSMFGFENLNGYLGGFHHGTRRKVSQISFGLELLQSLPSKLQELCEEESETTKRYLKQLLNKKRPNMQEIGDHCYAVG